MSGPIFRVSHNKSDFCHSPITCATRTGHLVAWVSGVDSDSILLASAYTDKKSGPTVEVCKLADTDSILFLRHLYENMYVLAIETENGTNVYILDEHAAVHASHVYNNTDLLVHCHATETTITLFTYNHTDDTMSVGSIPEYWNSEEYTLHKKYAGVGGVPQVFVKGDQYLAGWVTDSDELQVVTSNNSMVTLESYDVDYLMGAEVDEDLVVFCGYNHLNNVLRLDFFNFDGEHLTSRYWKSKEYKNKHFSLATLKRGFMLLADGPNDIRVCGQRFTHLGSWLYPMLNFVDAEEPTWSPALSCGEDQTLLVYIRDYDDHSEVWGKWLDIGLIPELDQLTLADLNC